MHAAHPPIRWTLCLALVAALAGTGCAEPTANKPDKPADAPAAAAAANESDAPAAAPDQPAPPKKIDLPNFDVNVEQGYVDAKGAVALREGVLELVVTVRSAKEHESVFVINGRPQHLHLALLMLGAEPGSPGRWEYVDKKPVAHDPKGAKVAVSVVIEEDGKPVERPMTAFVRHMQTKKPLPSSVFVFAGSRVAEEPDGDKLYLADATGDVVTLVTFDGELLALPDAASNANDNLEWESNPEHLPEVGEPVTLRFRPVKAKADKPAQPEGGASK